MHDIDKSKFIMFKGIKYFFDCLKLVMHFSKENDDEELYLLRKELRFISIYLY